MAKVNFSSWAAEPINNEDNTYVITHGYRSSSSEQWVENIAQSIEQRDSLADIILTDWSDTADTFNYFSAVEETDDVGNRLATWLSEEKVNPDTNQLIGHSLGAHGSGMAGDLDEGITGRSIETIVGLDPADPKLLSNSRSTAKVNFSSWAAEPINNEYNTYVITHGYRSSSSQEWVENMAQSIETRDPFANIILSDWSETADSFNYFRVIEETEDVGNQLAIWLSEEGVNPDTTQLIGHSLGAHVSGIAGDAYEHITGSSIETIVGLDPAGPGYEDFLFFSGKSPEERLDSTDADRVVAFHTSDIFGYDDPLGTLDLYINPDDWFQPGETSASGNHSYAHELYTELLGGNGYSQNNQQALGDGIFDYQDLFAFSGSIDVSTTNTVFVS